MSENRSSKHKIFSKAMALLIAAALLSGVAACGSDDSKNKNPGKTRGTSQATRAKDGPNIIEFDDSDDEDDDVKQTKSKEEDVVTTTTTTAPSRTKKTTATESTTKKNTTAKPTETKTTTKATTATTKATTTTTTQPAPQLHNKYKVTYKNYTSEDGKLKYKYPQITGLYDESMQNFYNDYFKKNCTGALKDSAIDTFKGTYEVKNKTKDTLSIVFRENFLYSGAAHGYSCAYAITIDLATGNTLIPSESVNMDKAADAITNDTWTLTRSADGVTKKNIIDYFSQFDEETIKNTLSVENMIRIKNSGGKYTVSGKTNCNSYLDVNGDPVLILEVNHALGDYVEVQF